MNREEKIEQIKKKKYFVKGDVAVFAAALLLICAFFLFPFLMPEQKGEEFAVVYKNEEIFRASLLTDAEYVFYVSEGAGRVESYSAEKEYKDYNRISVQGGEVRVTGSDCPDHTCEWQGSVRYGDIICLPHGLRIEIRGKGLETDV